MSVTITTEPSALRMDDAGTIRIGTSRVTLDTLAAAFAAGATPEQIAQDYPGLDLAEIYASLGYYLRHQQELDDYLARRQEAADTFRRENPGLYPQGIRERLLARRRAQTGH